MVWSKIKVYSLLLADSHHLKGIEKSNEGKRFQKTVRGFRSAAKAASCVPRKATGEGT